jgi:hypothetical protein
VVAATGPSLTVEVAEACRGQHVIAVNDAYRLMPYAEVLYACDAVWWAVHEGCPGFAGERWSSHQPGANEKLTVAERYGINLVRGGDGNEFSMDPSVIHYGSNSGFQAINLAIHLGARRIVLVGFDMRNDGPKHFFGDHPDPMYTRVEFESLIPNFAQAAKALPREITIVNCTPGSRLTCFPMVPLEEMLGCPQSR